MKKTISLLSICLMRLVGTYASAATARRNTVKRPQSSVDVLQAIMVTPDKGIPEEVLSSAKCILVVPDLIRIEFIFGGKHGRGVALAEPLTAGAHRIRLHRWRQLGIADRRRRCGPGYAGHE